MTKENTDGISRKKFQEFIQNALDMGITKEEIADELNVSRATVDRWSRGRTAPSQYAREAIITSISNTLTKLGR